MFYSALTPWFEFNWI